MFAFVCIALMVAVLCFSFMTMNYGSASWVQEPVNPTWRSTCDAWFHDCRRSDWKWYQ